MKKILYTVGALLLTLLTNTTKTYADLVIPGETTKNNTLIVIIAITAAVIVVSLAAWLVLRIIKSKNDADSK